MKISVPDFFKITTIYLKEEELRVQQYHNEFRIKVRETVVDSVLCKYITLRNDDSGIFQLLKAEKLQQVKILYDFLTSVNAGKSCFIPHVLNYTKLKTGEIKKDFSEQGENADKIKFFEKLSNFRKTIMDICKYCFDSNREIVTSVLMQLNSEILGVEDFPKLLATHIDDFIVKNGKNLDSDPVQEQITDLFEMVDLTADRYSLLYYYEQALKRRLFSFNNYNESMENEFLKRMTQVVGEQQIIKIKGMIQDMTNSKKTTSDFQDFIKNSQYKYEAIKEIEIEISLLTNSKWPTGAFEIGICSVPQDIQNIESAFNDFYQSGSIETDKRIDWLHGEGSIEVIGKLKEGRKNFLVSVPQYSVLDCLQNANSEMMLSVGEIKQRVNFSKEWLAAIFQPLLEQKVLKREKEIKEKLKDEELVWINTEFSSKNRNINLIDRKLLKGGDSNQDALQIEVEKKIQVEAAIIKIMKSKKRVRFNELMADVKNLLHNSFWPSDQVLRLVIEDLIKKEFISRDDKDMNIFLYNLK